MYHRLRFDNSFLISVSCLKNLLIVFVPAGKGAGVFSLVARGGGAAADIQPEVEIALSVFRDGLTLSVVTFCKGTNWFKVTKM